MKIGVLALQGAFREHAEALTALGADVALVKRPEHLDSVDAIFLPGGESTTIDKLLDSSELRAPLTRSLRDGLPAFATCAGLILCATEIIGRAPRPGAARGSRRHRPSQRLRPPTRVVRGAARRARPRRRRLPGRVHPRARRRTRRARRSRCSRSYDGVPVLGRAAQHLVRVVPSGALRRSPSPPVLRQPTLFVNEVR